MIVMGHRSDLNESLLDQMHRLRAKVFRDQRNWDVNVINEHEIDEFDVSNPYYVLVVDEDQNVLGSARLLPTTAPHMLSTVFYRVVEDEGLIQHPLIWESTRFCIDIEKCRGDDLAGISAVTGELVLGICQAANKAGLVRIISVLDPAILRILRRCGCSFEKYGKTVRMEEGGVSTLAALFDVGDEAEARIEDAISINDLSSYQKADEDARQTLH